MADIDYTGTPHDTLRNTIEIVQACLLAGRSDLIVARLEQGRSAADVRAELLAETAPPPARTARTPSATRSIDDQLAEAAERRFRAQNPRG